MSAPSASGSWKRPLVSAGGEELRGLDLAGLVTFGAACFLGTYGLIRGNEDGWTSAPVLGSLIAGALLLAGFVVVERRSAAGRLTGRVALRLPLVTGLALIALGLLLMRGLTTASDWTHLLPGFVVGGLAIGIISPALAAAMVGVLSADQVGLASGINSTFRQLGIGVGIAVLGAVFTHHADGELVAWPPLAGFRAQQES